MTGSASAGVLGLASVLLVTLAAAAPPAPPPIPVEPAESQLPPVPPEWKTRGWTAVVPHAYVLPRLGAARARPDTAAPAEFWLKQGTRVPVLEQGQEWWRVGWTDGRAGWMRVKDLEPHAAFVLIDAATGRVVRRLAAKGQYGAVSDGKALWSVSNTGITRTSLEDRPAIWSYPAGKDQFASLPYESAWTPARDRFSLALTEAKRPKLAWVEPATGAVTLTAAPAPGTPRHLGGAGRVLYALDSEEGRPSAVHLLSAASGDAGKSARGQVLAASTKGDLFVQSGREVVRYSPELQTRARIRLPEAPRAGCLSPDGRVLGLTYETTDKSKNVMDHLALYDAQSMRRLLELQPGDGEYGTLLAVAPTRGGWLALRTGEGDGWMELQRFDRRGRPSKVMGGGEQWAWSPDGRSLYLAAGDAVLRVAAESGRVSRFPIRWRAKLPANLLPRNPQAPGDTHREVSSLTVSPDGKLLILTEWLSGDQQA